MTNLMSPSSIFNNYQLGANPISSIPLPIPQLTAYHFLLGPFECVQGVQLSRSPTLFWKGSPQFLCPFALAEV